MSYELRPGEALALAFTGMRLLLIPAIIWAVAVSVPLAVGLGCLFVLADIADGVYARSAGCESNLRRIMDCTIDRVAIHAGLLTVVVLRPGFAWLYVPILARDVVATIGFVWMIDRRNVLMLGGRAHMVSSLADALFGLMLLIGAPATVYASATLALVANYTLMLDYIGGFVWAGQLAGDRPTLTRVKLKHLSGLQMILSPTARPGLGRQLRTR